jgi:hypothetical protein
VPDLPPEKWVGTPAGSLRNSCDIVPNLQARGTVHDHRAVYTNADALTWEKLAWFLKCHLDLCHLNSAPPGPLVLKFAGSLARAVRRPATTYGPTTIIAGCAWEELVHVALGDDSPDGLRCAHGECCDPLNYAVETSVEVQWAMESLVLERRLLEDDSTIIGRFHGPVADLCARHGTAYTEHNHVCDAPSAELFAKLKAMEFVNVCGDGNFGFDRRTREAGNAKSVF